MVMEDPQRDFRPAKPSRARERGAALPLVVVALAAGVAALMLPFLVFSQGQEPARTGSQPPPNQNQFQGAERLIENWPKPDVALITSGQMHGYLQPCGCSEPQKGGLARRYNFLKSLKDRGWNVVLADVGDLPQASGPQAVLKYKVAMNALKQMGYTAISFGKNEMGLGLVGLLGEYSLNDPEPRVIAANLANRDKDPISDMVGDGIVSKGPGPKVGFISIVDNSLLDFQDPDVKLEKNVNAAVTSAMSSKAFKEAKPELLVLLFQGKFEDAKKIANSNNLPKFDAIVVPIPEEEASSDPIKVGKTLIYSAGQRGREVSVLGVYRTNNPKQPFEFRYQLVQIGPNYETPKGQDSSNPIHALLQDYAQSVRNKNMLAEFTKNPSKHPTQVQLPGSTYVGSDKCKQCHQAAFGIWANSGHAQAYNSLVNKAVRPTLRQFDGECVRCHVTGFGYESGFVNQAATPKLVNVGCEACHGPASAQVKDPNNLQIREIINPWKNNSKVKNLHGDQALEKKMLLINDSCATCHDLDNSVGFKVEKYWKQVEHPTPKE